MRGLIVEGVVGSGKTTLLGRLHERIQATFPSASKLYLSEHVTQRMIAESEPTWPQVRTHLDLIAGTLGDYHGLWRHSPFASRQPPPPILFVTLERFALTHLATMPADSDGTAHARSVLARVGSMGLKQLVLRVPEAQLADRILSTKRFRNDAWRSFLADLGDEEKIVRHFSDWQQRLLLHAQASTGAIQTVILDVADRDPAPDAWSMLND